MERGYSRDDMSEVEILINQLYEVGPNNNADMLNLLQQLDHLFNSWPSDKTILVSQFVDAGYCNLIVERLVSLRRSRPSADIEELMTLIYQNLDRFASVSAKFSIILAKNADFQEILRSNLAAVGEAESRSGRTAGGVSILDMSVGILHIIVSHNVVYFSDAAMKRTLTKLLDSQSLIESHVVLCLLTLGMMMNERDEELLVDIELQTLKEVLGTYTDFLREACKEKSRTSRGFSVVQLLRGLINLCVADCDDIRTKLIFTGFPELFKVIITLGKLDEVTLAFKIMRSLCQSSKASLLVTDYKIDTCLQPLLTQPGSEVKKLATELLSDLGNLPRKWADRVPVPAPAPAPDPKPQPYPLPRTPDGAAAGGQFSLGSMSMDVPEGAWRSWTNKQLADQLLAAGLDRSSVLKLNWLSSHLLVELVRYHRCSPPTFCNMIDKIKDDYGIDVINTLKLSAFISGIDKFK